MQNINETFKSIPSPLITHLCLPGDFLNASSGDFRARARSRVLAVQPIARPTPFDSAIDWPSLSSTFPSLTHLSLPDLLVPSNTSIGLIPHTLVKLSLLQGSSPIPIIPLTNLILDQCHSLRTIHLGQILPKSTGAEEFHQLGEALASCSSLEDFRLDCAQIGEMQAIVTQAMNRFSTQLIHGMKGSWRKSLKVGSTCRPVMWLIGHSTLHSTFLDLLRLLVLPLTRSSILHQISKRFIFRVQISWIHQCLQMIHPVLQVPFRDIRA